MTNPLPKTPAAVLFDCDGVLADSEALANRIVAADLSARGWAITPEQCQGIFLGRSLPDMVPVIEAQLAKSGANPLPPHWAVQLSDTLVRRMREEVPPMAGALEALRAVMDAGIPVACASNSGRAELAAKLQALGLTEYFGNRVFSYQDVRRPKPYPDMYLAAAAACGAAPADCVVVEDSAIGARAGVAAGCRVFGFAHETPARLLQAEGAQPFHSMAELPGLLGIAQLATQP
jgi:HAD superfamily hydrolase (TIGR01509 family)